VDISFLFIVHAFYICIYFAGGSANLSGKDTILQ